MCYRLKLFELNVLLLNLMNVFEEQVPFTVLNNVELNELLSCAVPSVDT